MIGRTDYHRVDLIVHIVEHLAEVMELWHVVVSAKRCCRTTLVDIAKCDDVFTSNSPQVRSASPAGAD
jgi:hypothetical protein